MPELTRFQFALLAVVVATVVFVGGRALRTSADHAAGAGASDVAAFGDAGADTPGVANPARDAATPVGPGPDDGGAGAGTDPVSAAAPDGTGPGGADGSGGVVLVHVAGAVRRPGLYRLPASARVGDAVERAGGARGRADLDAVNLAAKLQDGEQVLVPRRGHAGATSGLAGPTGVAPSAGAAAPSAGAAAASAGATAAGAPGGVVDLNRATAVELDTLDGVGPAIAQKILDYRAQHGSFRSIEELAQVPGIGPKKLAAIRPRVRIG